jgi:integrase
MPIAEWPALDLQAWEAGLRSGTPFEPGGPAASWADATRETVQNGYGRWLTWLKCHDLLDPSVPPADRITKERLAAYESDLRSQVADFTVFTRVQQVGDALRAMVPDKDWRWILRAAHRIRSLATPARDKRSRLQSPDRLIDLGMQLMAEAESRPERSLLQRALTYRDGLIIAFLAYRPVRARTLTAISLGQQLISRGGSWWLIFGPEDTKTRQRLEFPFPAELVPQLECYLAVHRPALLSRGGRRPTASTQALWVSQDCGPMGQAAISYWIHRRTKAAFGKTLGPHMFRDAAATAIAIFDPEHVLIIKSILGHATITTSEKHYNMARGLEAGRRYYQTIRGLRRQGHDGSSEARVQLEN